MAKPYNIIITNGEGQENVLNDNYSVSANIPGYNNTSIDPSTVNVVEGTNTYEFTIAASGTLTLHVTEEGTSTGRAVVGAKFIRCDAMGVTYGSEVETDSTGNATLPYVPYDANSDIEVYYKQTASDDSHLFDDTLKSAILKTSTLTVEIANTLPALRTFTLKDTNYNGLSINSGNITLN